MIHWHCMSQLGHNLARLRLALKMSQSDLALLAKTDQGTISRVENGKATLIPESLQRLADALKTTVSDLLAEPYNVRPVTMGGRRVPVLDRAQVGRLAAIKSAENADGRQKMVNINGDYSPETFAFEVTGSSMTPRFQPGDIVVIDPAVRPQAENFVIAINSTGEGTFKRYHSRGVDEDGRPAFELVPLNPAYETLDNRKHAIQIVGTMVEHHSFRRD